MSWFKDVFILQRTVCKQYHQFTDTGKKTKLRHALGAGRVKCAMQFKKPAQISQLHENKWNKVNVLNILNSTEKCTFCPRGQRYNSNITTQFTNSCNIQLSNLSTYPRF